MISLLSGTTPQDTNGAFAVLALLANPDAAKERLTQLVAERKTAQDLYDKMEAASKQHEQDKEDIAALYSKIAARESAVSEREKKATAIETSHEQKAAELAASEQKLNEQTAAVNDVAAKREVALAEKEKVAALREKQTADALKDAKDLKASWEKKLAKIKTAVEG